MKMFIFAALAILALNCEAQTNTQMIFDELLSCSNTILMTNAEFRCTSGTRVFFLSNGSYQAFDASELNSNVLLKAGISISNLQAAITKEKLRRAAFANEKAAIADYEYHLSTNSQIIEILSTDGLNCETDRGNIVIRGLPGSVNSFLAQKQQIQSEIDNLENYHPTATTTVYDPNDPDPAETAEMLNQEKLEDLQAQKNQKLNDLNSQLDRMELSDAERTTIRAYFTGRRYAGMDIWQFVSMGSVRYEQN